MIDSVAFGQMTILAKTYTKDLKILSGRVVPNWWREQGHLVQKQDIVDIVRSKPRVLVIGSGISGAMRVSKQVSDDLESINIKLIVAKTDDACEQFNSLFQSGEEVAGAFHLTC